MAKVEIVKPKIITFEFHQEKEDDDYGSCLWARFNFDLENYCLQIASDCGDYGSSWIPTPKTETFLQLMTRCDTDYLLRKLSTESEIDVDATYLAVKEFVVDSLGKEWSNSLYQSISDACCLHNESDVYNELVKVLEDHNICLDPNQYELFSCIQKTYPRPAKRIINIFDKYIRPEIRKYLKGE